MAATSIHYEAAKPGSERHNKREKKLDYVFEDRTKYNEYWECDTQKNRLAKCKEDVKAKTGRKMQAKAVPIQEAVVVIDERTTMADLQKLAARFKERFNIEVFQIAIHRDEGYKHGDGTKLNLHAHLVTDMINHETGKSARLTRKDMAEMQTITAEVLGMERGVTSEKKHLDALAYKIAAEQQRTAKLQSEIKELEKQIDNLSTTKVLKEEAKEAVLGVFGGSKRQKTIKDQEKQLEALRSQNKALSKHLKAMAKEADEREKKIELQEKQIGAWQEKDRLNKQTTQRAVAEAERSTRRAVEYEAKKEVAAAEQRAERAERTLGSFWTTIKQLTADYYRAAVEGIVLRCTQPNVRFFSEHHVEGIRTMMAPFDGAEAKQWVGRQLMSEGKAEAYKRQSRYSVDSWAQETARDVQRIANGEQVRTMSQGRGMSR